LYHKISKGQKKNIIGIDKSYITYQYHNELLMQYVDIVYEDPTLFWGTK